ncbi:hypothetical protein VM1G_11181 [Cytospora mali]|uniref:Uncharacterized protein n=1 Tax=Cytospora mali TaxID=578113 RepID=A0A194VK94_CYTMA|nr:hypothetical protein VM1G_11181 [Valsa mali]
MKGLKVTLPPQAAEAVRPPIGLMAQIHSLAIEMDFDRNITIQFPPAISASDFDQYIHSQPYHRNSNCSVVDGNKVKLKLPRSVNGVQATRRPGITFIFNDAKSANDWRKASALWQSTDKNTDLYLPVRLTNDIFEICVQKGKRAPATENAEPPEVEASSTGVSEPPKDEVRIPPSGNVVVRRMTGNVVRTCKRAQGSTPRRRLFRRDT